MVKIVAFSWNPNPLVWEGNFLPKETPGKGILGWFSLLGLMPPKKGKTAPGLKGVWIGLGVDEYGNFGNCQ